MRFRFLAMACVIASVLVATGARAERRTVALVNGNDVLERQVRIALSAWDLEVKRVDWTSLSSGMPQAAVEARQVAAAHAVDAVVWISETGSEHALWIYDVATGHAVTRPISIPAPTDTADAASVALTLKTLMRSTTAAPPGERIGAGAERPVGAAGVFRAEADGGARFLTTSASPPELRFALTALWFPRAFGQYLGVAMGFGAGPGLSVNDERVGFRGRFLDVTFSPALRAHFPLGARFGLEPSVGGSLHLTYLEGATSLPPAFTITRTKGDASLDGAVLLAFALTGGVSIGVRGGASYLLTYQRYLVGSAVILPLSSLQANAGLVLGARLN